MRTPEFIDHKGKRILYIDLSDMRIQQQEDAFERIRIAQDTIAKQAPGSLLILTNVENAQFDKQIAKRMREYVAHNKPFVKASAVIGLKGLQIPLYNAINKITGRNMRSFSTEHQALEWLLESSA